MCKLLDLRYKKLKNKVGKEFHSLVIVVEATMSKYGRLVMVACALIMILCPSFVRAAPDEETKKTWEQASVWIPGKAMGGAHPEWGIMRQSYIQKALSSISPEDSLPAVIYLHGCEGINTSSEIDAGMLAGLGFLVVAPSSFAREGRRSNCRSLGQQEPRAIKFRLEEIELALEKLKKIPGVDGNHIFLMGHSEGGEAAARFPKTGFAGHIITGWTCVSLNDKEQPSEHDGLKVPESVPVLAIVASKDPAYPQENTGHCGQRMADRSNGRSIVLEENMHWVNGTREARKAIEEFLISNTLTKIAASKNE